MLFIIRNIFFYVHKQFVLYIVYFINIKYIIYSV